MPCPGIDAFVDNGAFWASFVVFAGYGLAIAPFSYLLSFLFSKHTSAQILSLVVNFLTGLLLMLTSYILNLIESTKDVNASLMWIYRLFPGFCLGHGLFEICTNSVISEQLGVEDIHLLGWGVAGKDALFLYLLAPIYFALAVLVDVVAHSPLAAWSRHLDPVGNEVPAEEDEDVANERRRVSESDADVVRLLGLRKVYRTPEGHPKVAVHSLSYGLPKVRAGLRFAEEHGGMGQAMNGRDGWDEPQAGKMPNVPDHGSSEDEGHPHVAEVSDTHILKEVYHDNAKYKNKLSKMIRDYDLRFGGKAAEIQAALKVDPNTFTGTRLALHRWISWWGFDTLIGVVILGNSVVIGFESSVRAEMPLGCTGDCLCQNQLDPTLTCTGVPLWIILADYGFYAVYLTEFILRLGVYGVFVLKSHWVKFDGFLVCASTLDIIVGLVSNSEFLNQVMLVGA
ncbi:ABCA1 [Symbiodinium natans]|uniref:ABCA1 protein n=1 Tax=Symbiodinium natans TaxID=878477 RepID=A0A812GER7_9DINO|nr:ABCA1 [Symbiodinium natans]